MQRQVTTITRVLAVVALAVTLNCVPVSTVTSDQPRFADNGDVPGLAYNDNVQCLLNRPPEARFCYWLQGSGDLDLATETCPSPPNEIYANQTIAFSAIQSDDVDGSADQLAYRWTVECVTCSAAVQAVLPPFDPFNEREAFYNVIVEPGDPEELYRFSLTVFDECGEQDTFEQLITIFDRPDDDIVIN